LDLRSFKGDAKKLMDNLKNQADHKEPLELTTR
jgi:hypothetical protein